MTSANLLAHSFAIGEAGDDDPIDAKPIRMLDDQGTALPADQQVVYVARGVLTRPRQPVSPFDPKPEDHPLATFVDDGQPWPADRSCE